MIQQSHCWAYTLRKPEGKETRVPQCSSQNWCFWTVVLEKTLESPLGCKEIQPVHPKGDQSWCSLKRLILKLKLQYFGHLMWLIGKDPDAGKDWRQGGEGDDRGWDGWMSSLTWWTWVWVSSGSWWWTGKPGVLQSMGSQSWTRLSDWTELIGLNCNK